MTKIHNQNLSKENQELATDLARLFKKDREEIIKSIDLFSNLSPIMKNILYCLSKIKEEKHLNVFLSLEFLSQSNQTIMDILKK